MNTNTLSFPSGRTINRCRQDAKTLVQTSKLTAAPIQLNAALDKIASDNGINLPWSKALQQLKVVSIKKPKIAQVHLLGHALNMLIKKDLIDMDSTEGAGDGYIECELCGKPSIITWRHISCGEINLSVWWNFDKTKHPQHLEGGYKNRIILDNLSEKEQMKYAGTNKGIYTWSNSVETFSLAEPLAKPSKYIDFVGVLCSSWIERETGKYLQIKDGQHIYPSYIRKSDKKALCSIPDCIPLDFELEGRFHM